jgi:TRAP-type C4-dicarboxylate transport system substrate-binding protein
MKKSNYQKRLVVITFVTGILFILAVSPTVVAAEKKIVWTFTQMPLGNFCDNEVYSEWLPKRMLEATKGQLELNIPVNLVPQPEVLQAVRDGVIHGATGGAEYHAGEWPIGSFAALPGLLRSNDEFYQVATQVAWNYWDESLRRKYGIRLMGITHWPGIHVFAKKPIVKLEDFKGQKLRGTGYYDSRSMQLAGASAIQIPWSEAFLSLQRGVVDGLVTGAVVYESMGFWEYAKYINPWPLRGVSGGAFIIVNEKAFNELPENLKPIVKNVLKAAGQRISSCNVSRVESSIKTVVAKGVKMTTPDPSEIEKCIENTKPVKAEWLEKCRQAGTPEAEEMLREIESFLIVYRNSKNK